MSRKVSRKKSSAGHCLKHSRLGSNVGALGPRPREIRAVAVEAQMELFATLDAENVRDLQIIHECKRRIALRERRKQELREANKRLEGLRVAS